MPRPICEAASCEGGEVSPSLLEPAVAEGEAGGGSHPSHPWKGPGYQAVPQAVRNFHQIHHSSWKSHSSLSSAGRAKQGWESASAPRCTRESSRSTSTLGAMQEKQIFNDLMGL